MPFGKTRLPETAFTGKIFCIGLSGTGTRSFNYAMRLLGFKTCHYPQNLDEFERHQVLADIPVACRYRDLDVLFPGSKFILTTREKQSWLKNRSRKPADRKLPNLWERETRLRTYGRLQFEHDHYVKLYDEYHDGVDQFFAGREQDLLKIEIVSGEGWEQLCPFVGISEIPARPFPLVKGPVPLFGPRP